LPTLAMPVSCLFSLGGGAEISALCPVKCQVRGTGFGTMPVTPRSCGALLESPGFARPQRNFGVFKPQPTVKRRRLVMFDAPGLFIICPVFLCSWPVADVQVPSKALPAPPAPGKSLPAIQVSRRVTRSWSAQGVKTVVLRAAAADKAEIVAEGGDRSVTVSGVPVGRGLRATTPPTPIGRKRPSRNGVSTFRPRRSARRW
jgi:hypothetical protein